MNISVTVQLALLFCYFSVRVSVVLLFVLC